MNPSSPPEVAAARSGPTLWLRIKQSFGLVCLGALLVGLGFIGWRWAATPGLTGFVRSAKGGKVTARVSGVVAQVPASPGQRVAAGDPLVVLENAPLKQEREMVRLRLSLIEDRLRELRELMLLRHIPLKDSSERCFDLKREQAELKHRGQELDRQVGDLVVRAPSDGYVTHLAISLGQAIEPGVLVAELFDPYESLVELEIEPDELAEMKNAKEFEITFETHPGVTVAYRTLAWKPVTAHYMDDGGPSFRRQTRHLLLLKPVDPSSLPQPPAEIALADGTPVSARIAGSNSPLSPARVAKPLSEITALQAGRPD